MKAENIMSEPIRTTYKVGVYSALGFIGVFLASFITWSFACLGGACLDLLGRLN